MTSVAERKRKHRARTKTPASPRLVVDNGPKPKQRHYEHDTGLSWLAHKGAISQRQKQTGERYGQWYRGSTMEPHAMRSCLDDRPRGTGAHAIPMGAWEESHAWIIECREKLSLARSTLNNHTGLIAVMDLICGKQYRATELLTNQRERDDAVSCLRIALDMMEGVR